MKKLSIFFGLAIALVLVGAGCQDAINQNTELPEESEITVDVDGTSEFDGDESAEATNPTQYFVLAENVSTVPEWKGEAQIIISEDETRIYASFQMDVPEEGFFYEGWLVCDGKPISTGATSRFEGIEENYFIGEPMEGCTDYVLTLEPEDNDPAPAEHLFDGVIDTEIGYFGDDYWYTDEFEAQANG